MVSKEHEEGRREVWEASGGLSENQMEADEEAQHHIRVEAWEEGVLSYLEAPGGPLGVHKELGEACP